MDNGTTEKVIDHFNKVSQLPDNWDHNRQYQKFMLRQIGKKGGRALDIGCGTGEFCKSMLDVCDFVTGIDVAPKMIEEAVKRNTDNRIQYLATDASSFLDGCEDCLDIIASIATFHHLNYADILEKCRRALKKGGVLVIQDLYAEKTLRFYLLSLAGMLLNPFFMFAKNGRLHVTKEESDVWSGHREDDHYNSIKEIRKIAGSVLEDIQIRRHLFWRYTLVYRKKECPERQDSGN